MEDLEIFICEQGHKLTIVLPKDLPRPPFCMSCLGKWI